MIIKIYRYAGIHIYIHRYDPVLHSSFKHYDTRTFKCSFHEGPQEIHQITFTLAEKNAYRMKNHDFPVT